jgi:stringent starvation protein B
MRIDNDGIQFSVRHSGEYSSVKVPLQEATEAYVDLTTNDTFIILSAGDGENAATLQLETEAAERIRDELTEVLE